MNGVSQSTISRINTRVTKLLAALQNQFIRFPNKSEVDCNKVRFYDKGKFPDVVGCIGSTHVGVRVKGIRDYNVGYINENGYHSVRVQVSFNAIHTLLFFSMCYNCKILIISVDHWTRLRNIGYSVEMARRYTRKQNFQCV